MMNVNTQDAIIINDDSYENVFVVGDVVGIVVVGDVVGIVVVGVVGIVVEVVVGVLGGRVDV